MSNFYTKRVAQESIAEIEVTAMQEDSFEDDSYTPVAELQKDGDLLADDLGTVIDVTNAVANNPDDATANMAMLATESIRKRWGLTNVRKVAQEARGSRGGISGFISGMLDRFFAWLKEMRDKLRDFWLNFTNKGSRLAKRAKAKLEECDSLGTIKDTTINGKWLTQLTVNGKFIGDDRNAIEEMMNIAGTVANDQAMAFTASSWLLSEVGDAVLADTNKHQKWSNKADDIMSTGILSNGTIRHFTGNRLVKLEEDTFVITDKTDNLPENTDTPNIEGVKNACKLMELIGKRLEAHAKDFRKTDAARKDLSDKSSKITKGLSNAENKNYKSLLGRPGEQEAFDASYAEVIEILKRVVSRSTSIGNNLSKIEKYLWSDLGGGITGYVDACFAAYEKKKK